MKSKLLVFICIIGVSLSCFINGMLTITKAGKNNEEEILIQRQHIVDEVFEKKKEESGEKSEEDEGESVSESDEEELYDEVYERLVMARDRINDLEKDKAVYSYIAAISCPCALLGCWCCMRGVWNYIFG